MRKLYNNEALAVGGGAKATPGEIIEMMNIFMHVLANEDPGVQSYEEKLADFLIEDKAISGYLMRQRARNDVDG